MCSTSCSTDYSAIRLFVLGLAIMKKLLGIVVLEMCVTMCGACFNKMA